MEWGTVTVGLGLGFVLGFGVAYLCGVVRRKRARDLVEECFVAQEQERRAHMDSVIEHMKASFGSLSLDALSKSTEEFLKLAKAKLEMERQAGTQELDAKEGLIDQQLQKMAAEMENVGKLMTELEKDRVEKFGELSKHLQLAGEQTALLLHTTGLLKETLASSKARGQWGERMAEDILRLAGFKENISFVKQKTIEGIGSRPDFTFLLPKDLKLNMDVKFPLDNYVRFLEAQGDAEKTGYRADFLRDVRAKIKELTTRDYINVEQKTVDCVLLFIPNEQIYAFIHEQDSLILEEGMRQKVVCCSPATLFAVLAVVRQAVDAFSLEQTSNEILSLLGNFKRQWDEYTKKFDLLGKRIDDLHKEYEGLAVTRRRQLERPLRRIEELRNERRIEPASWEDNDGGGSENVS